MGGRIGFFSVSLRFFCRKTLDAAEAPCNRPSGHCWAGRRFPGGRDGVRMRQSLPLSRRGGHWCGRACRSPDRGDTGAAETAALQMGGAQGRQRPAAGTCSQEWPQVLLRKELPFRVDRVHACVVYLPTMNMTVSIVTLGLVVLIVLRVLVLRLTGPVRVTVRRQSKD